MEIVREFVRQIIGVSIIAIIIELILPKGNTKKYVYVILSLFVLLNIISPVFNSIRELDDNNVFDNVLSNISGKSSKTEDEYIQAFSEFKNTKITENLKENISKDIRNKLLDKEFILKDIKIRMDDEYNLENFEIIIGNLDINESKKAQDISNVITMISEKYDIDEDKIIITEEAKK